MDELLHRPIDEVAALIRTRELSPVELVDAALALIDAMEPKLSAFSVVLHDRARAAAAKAEAEIVGGAYRGPLHGIPIGMKELYDVKGLPTTCSSKVRHDHLATQDSASTELLEAAGAIVVGKTETHEFAFGIKTPRSGNPWNPGCIPGGSSGGSGAAVAAGALFMGMGSDTGGSIRIPAALCGTVGIKPTFGRCSRFGVASLSWSLDHVGPLTRTVKDAAHCLQALAGHDARDPGSADVPVPYFSAGIDGGVEGLRIGVPRNYFFTQVEPEVEAATRAAVRVLERRGAEIVEVEIPFADEILPVEYGLCLAEASAYHRETLRTRAELYEPDVRTFLEAGELIPATDYIQCQRLRLQIREAFAELFADVDVIMAPTVAAEAVERDADSYTWPDGTVESLNPVYVRLSAPANVTGLPSIAVPTGFGARGLPVSAQIIGPAFGEATILRAAQAHEAATDWHTRRPPL
ncbi:MAG: amidase [Pseudomonadota bacterium]